MVIMDDQQLLSKVRARPELLLQGQQPGGGGCQTARQPDFDILRSAKRENACIKFCNLPCVWWDCDRSGVSWHGVPSTVNSNHARGEREVKKTVWASSCYSKCKDTGLAGTPACAGYLAGCRFWSQNSSTFVLISSRAKIPNSRQNIKIRMHFDMFNFLKILEIPRRVHEN